MRHDIALSGYRFRLRPVERQDAKFIVGLRTDPDLARFLHETSPRVEDQESWIDAYMHRPGDWYFIVEDLTLAEPVGTIGIYDLDERTGEAEWGRWLIRRGSLAALESVVLLHRIGLEKLGLNALVSSTIIQNEQVVSFHRSFGAEEHALRRGRFVVRGVSYDALEHRIDRARWDAVSPKLEMLTRRLGQR